MSSPTTAPARPGALKRLAPLLLDIGLPLAVYYGLRQTGLGLSWCYAAGAATGALIVGYAAVKKRKLDGFAVFVLAGFAVQLAVSLLTDNVKLATLTDSITSGLTGVAMLVSLWIGRPAIQAIALKVAGTTEDSRRRIESRWALPGYRQVISTMTLVFGLALIAEAVVRVGLVIALGPDAVVGASRVLQIATIAGLVIWAKRYGKRTASRWS